MQNRSKKNENLEVINKEAREKVILDFSKEYTDSLEKPQFRNFCR